MLLNAYRFLVENGFDLLPALVLVGREGWLNNNLAYQVENDPGLKGRVIILTNASDQILDYLYRNCMFTLYPSIYEGWGLPIAESMNYGKPCITSNTSSMKEVAPEFTRFAHPLKLNEWVEHIQELSANDKILADESKRIKIEYTQSTWESAASKVMELIQK
jgi:glycosyltransferase involved in cell wall biosynthesis